MGLLRARLGGYWFWDPVENASFMPWLGRHGADPFARRHREARLCKSWTLRSHPRFSLSLLGTFLVRSGVLTSVHSFAADPTRGMFILGFLVIVVGGALALYAWRAPLLKSPGGSTGRRANPSCSTTTSSRRAAIMVFVGTMAPLIADATGRARVGRRAILRHVVPGRHAAVVRARRGGHPRRLERGKIFRQQAPAGRRVPRWHSPSV